MIRFAFSKLKLLAIGSLIVTWIFSQVIYARLGILGDQALYFAGGRNSGSLSLLNRSDFTAFVYSNLYSLGVGALVSLIPPAILILALWKDLIATYRLQDKKYLFILAIFLPHFWIWQTIASKESLFILPAMFLSLKMPSFLNKRPTLAETSLCLFSFIICLLIRPHYSIAYLIAFAPIALFIINPRLVSKILAKQGFGLQLFTLLFFVVVATSFVFLTFDHTMFDGLSQVMQVSERMFTAYDGNTTRLDINWTSSLDFFLNMYWGIPFSLIGFTPAEVLDSPLFIPAFIEGFLFLFLIFALACDLFRLSSKSRIVRYIFIYGIIPSFFAAIIIHYPFGVFNPGSAIRYRQSLCPLLLFFPLGIKAYARTSAFNSNVR